MKKPIIFALVATVYIVFIVSVMNFVSPFFQTKPDTIFAPMVVLGLFVLSAAIMGFLFLSEPIRLYMEGEKHRALVVFGKIVGFFACFVVLLVLLLFIF